VGSPKRERQKAGRQARLEQAKVVQARRQRFKLARNLGIVAVVVVGALFVLSRDGSGEDVTAGTSSTTSTSIDPSASTTPSTVAVTLPAPGATLTGETPCPLADGSAERTTAFAGPPPMCIDTARTYTAEVVTSEGTFTFELDDTAAPNTVNNFVVLARYHFYDGIPVHRIIPGFMNQAGDPIGPTPGQGGPGYTIPDELPTGEAPYPEGSVAMANTGQPDSGGSQWFVVVATGGDQLSPTYSRFGTVTSGIEVVRAINEFGDAATNGAPTKEIVIQSISISEA